MDSSSKTHSQFLILSHLIFVCKCRKKLVNTYGKVGKRIFEDLGAPSDFSFEPMEEDQDHLHCLIKSESRISPLAIVRRLKQESTFQLWKSYKADLKQHFWKERTFWSDGYFYWTIGNASQEAIRHSIVNQG